VTITKGAPWGTPGPLPADGVVVSSDAEARAIVTEAKRTGAPLPTLGLIGGDLCRTLCGRGDVGRLHSDAAMTFPVDLGAVLMDGTLRWFVAHLVARTRLWRQVFVAMNTPWLGEWNIGPRAHPDDALLDVFEARLGLADLLKVRARLGHGAHLPHPSIRERRVDALQVTFDRPRPVRLDGLVVGSARHLSMRVEPDALRVVV
jgi:hypothetical protein